MDTALFCGSNTQSTCSSHGRVTDESSDESEVCCLVILMFLSCCPVIVDSSASTSTTGHSIVIATDRTSSVRSCVSYCGITPRQPRHTPRHDYTGRQDSNSVVHCCLVCCCIYFAMCVAASHATPRLPRHATALVRLLSEEQSSSCPHPHTSTALDGRGGVPYILPTE